MAHPKRYPSHDPTGSPGSHPDNVPRSLSVPEVPSSLRLIEDDLTCSICYNLLEEPKDLNCPHTFCLVCLQKWSGKRPTVECPECRRVTIVPNGGLGQLRTNLRLKNMVEKYANHGMRRRQGLAQCDKHKGEFLHFYCENCDVKVCQACLVVDHPRPEHRIKNVSDASKAKKAEASALLQDAKRSFKLYEENMATLLEMSQQIQSRIDTEHDKIDQRIRAIISDAKAKGDAMKLHVTSNFERQREQIQEMVSNLDARYRALKEIYDKTQITLAETEDQNYVDKHNALVGRLQSVLDSDKYLERPKSPSCVFHPGPSIREPMLLGKLTIHRKLQFVADFGRGSCIKAQGITSTADGVIAVADSTQGRVSTHRFEHGKFIRINCLGSSKVPAGKLQNPSDVAVGDDDKYYVTDRSKPVVNIYLPTCHLERSFSTIPITKGERTPQSGTPACIATAPNGLVVVGGSNKNTITIHKPSGDLLRAFYIPHEGITQIATNGKQIAYVKTNLGKVIVIGFDSGDEILDIDCPNVTAACFDDYSGSILVAKAGLHPGKGEIHQYCLTIKQHVNCLANDLFMPLALTITASGKLAVADCTSVKVYNLI